MQNQLSVKWEWCSILISSLWNMNKITRSCYYQEISQWQDHLRSRIVDLHKLGRYFSGPLSKEPFFPRALLQRIVQKYNLFGLADTLPRSGQRAKLSPSDDRKLVEHQVKHQCPYPQWSEYCFSMDLEGANQGTYFKMDTFKLDCNLQLPTWTSQMPSGEMFYAQMRKCLSCLAKMTGDMFGGVKVRVSNLRTLYQLSSMLLLMHHALGLFSCQWYWCTA